MYRAVLLVLTVFVGSTIAAATPLAAPVPSPESETADEKPVLKKEYVIEIKDHRFIPAELVVPAGKKIRLRIVNLDESPEEFESYDLNREKIVGGKRKITVFIGPLKPGKYSYFGEFNPDTAQGVIIAK